MVVKFWKANFSSVSVGGSSKYYKVFLGVDKLPSQSRRSVLDDGHPMRYHNRGHQM